MSEAITTSSFSSSERDAVEREVDVSDAGVVNVADLSAYFDLPQCAQFLVDGAYGKAALQFPDSLLRYSTAVITELESSVPGCQLFVLADTSYGSCCVDEVAAEHVAAEAVIHFGHTCLSSVRRMPVLYSFGREPVDVEACCESFSGAFPDSSSRVLLMCDTIYESHLGLLSSKLQTSYPGLIVGQIAGRALAHTRSEATASCFVRQPREEMTSGAVNGESGDRSCAASTENRHLRCGREFVLADGSTLSDYSVFYVGSSDMALNNHMMTFSQSPFFLYDPQRHTSSAQLQTAVASRSLRRRYVQMLKAKEASTVGVLAGTLGVAEYMAVMRRLKQILKQAGKKFYTFSLGKLNVAKLANFPEIDVFVLVACPESTLISSEDFYKPVVTPYELEVACNRSRDWTGSYVTDFRLLLPGAAHYVGVDEDMEEDDEPDFSLISGGLLSRHRGDQTTTAAGSQALVHRADGQVATLDAGASFLAQRSWSGLDPQLGQTPVADAVVEGRTGVASGYTHELGHQMPAAAGACCRGTADDRGCCRTTDGGDCGK